jgi:hypothetical protein
MPKRRLAAILGVSYQDGSMFLSTEESTRNFKEDSLTMNTETTLCGFTRPS